MVFQESFKEDRKVFWGSFKGVSRKFQGAKKKFQGCFKEVSRVFHESFKEVEVSRIFHDFQGCSGSVSKVFQESLKKTFRVFQKSLMLHVTHCSFPSRRRACYLTLYSLRWLIWNLYILSNYDHTFWIQDKNKDLRRQNMSHMIMLFILYSIADQYNQVAICGFWYCDVCRRELVNGGW